MIRGGPESDIGDGSRTRGGRLPQEKETPGHPGDDTFGKVRNHLIFVVPHSMGSVKRAEKEVGGWRAAPLEVWGRGLLSPSLNPVEQPMIGFFVDY